MDGEAEVIHVHFLGLSLSCLVNLAALGGGGEVFDEKKGGKMGTGKINVTVSRFPDFT